MHIDLRSSRPQQGFSLIELMVGIVVAMAAVIVVMQVFRVSEGTRRTTTSGDDAQTTGAIALTVLQRDLRQAGQGLSNVNVLGCSLTLPAARTIQGLSPLTINSTQIPAGDANTDTLLISYGSGLGSPDGDRINVQPGGNVYAVATSTAFARGDFVVAAPQTRATPCALNLTTVSAIGTPNITVAAGTVGVANGTLYNWGRAPTIVAYAVRGGRLTSCNFQSQDCTSSAAANWSEVADGVVSLRALYGIDPATPLAGILTDSNYSQTTPTTACGWARVMAMKLVVVTRSGQLRDSADARASAPTWSAGATAPITLGGSWQDYRYKTFETTVPLRNLSWQGVLQGC